jgi:nucleoside-diphosphate-sugar epimerase
MSLTIFGGTGFVGKHYVDAYYHHAIGNIVSINAREDHEVYSEDVLYLISTVTNYGVFDDVHVDVDTNLTLLIDVLENWKKYQEHTGKRGVFNFISSWSVYGNQKELPVSETAFCDPRGFYIITKRCAEQLLIDYCIAFGLNYRILRLSNVQGPGDKPSPKKNALQYAINLLVEGKDVELFGDGRFYRDFMHVEDTVRAIELAMCKGNVNEIYNIGNGKTWTYAEIMDYVQDRLKTSGKVVYKAPNEFQKRIPVASFYMDITKLKNLGFVPQYTGNALYDSLIPREKVK